MDGEIHFHAAGRTIGQMPFDYWRGNGVIADISEFVSDTSVYTPAMIEQVADVQEGDILLVKTGWHKFGWNSPDSDEFRYMIKHPGPSPDFAQWCIDKKIKWLGIDCVAMEHPMNTIQRVFHPKTFEEANAKLVEQYGDDWDVVYPLDKYYQDMHLTCSQRHCACRKYRWRDCGCGKRALLYRCVRAEGHGNGFLLVAHDCVQRINPPICARARRAAS